MTTFNTIMLLVTLAFFLLNVVVHYRAGKLHRRGIYLKDGRLHEVGIYPAKVLVYMAIALTLDALGMGSIACIALSETVGMPANARMLTAIIPAVLFAILPIIAWYIAHRSTKEYEPIDLTENSPD